ncbi:hypothetical protein Desku_0918 [Desulfofundulus kuznetsovii DSM 6115]|uniref:Uncharacterized protein n=1 Tax=Desulfofundulus kuznetsovii (strain DSM 6115 / VKM B-1805 / 17) TaxID=760568 RepID=A0AAU8PLX6_DESK7|nr:hypothetical protein Desku_0918 [Desulfofundulus kuznetsovii DSM 6115]
MAGRAEDKAKNAEMVEFVEMYCKKCGSEIEYVVENSCPSCGFIMIHCPRCGYKFYFGE